MNTCSAPTFSGDASPRGHVEGVLPESSIGLQSPLSSQAQERGLCGHCGRLRMSHQAGWVSVRHSVPTGQLCGRLLFMNAQRPHKTYPEVPTLHPRLSREDLSH